MYDLTEVAKTEAVRVRYGEDFGLSACALGLRPKAGDWSLATGWQEIREQWQGKTATELGEDPILAAYRAFLMGRQAASENLLRRFLFEADINNINLVVDCLNLVSAQSRITLAAFDATQVSGEMILDLTSGPERLRCIGGLEIRIPAGGLVLRDQERTLSWVGRRDGEAIKVEAETQRVWLVGVRVPGVDVEVVEHALLEAVHALSTSFGLRLEAHAHQEPEVSV